MTETSAEIGPCVVCGDPDHAGYFYHNAVRFLGVDCPNADRPDIVALVASIKKQEQEERSND